MVPLETLKSFAIFAFVSCIANMTLTSFSVNLARGLYGNIFLSIPYDNFYALSYENSPFKNGGS